MKKVLKTFLVILVIALLYFVLVPIIIVNYGRSRIYTDTSKIPNYKVAIVFGAGLKKDGTPNDMLKDRLDTAAELYTKGKIEKFLLSGDNQSPQYNEPQAMYNYLVNFKEIPPYIIVRDHAGLRTYDTCIRAKKIWEIDDAILISQGYHLSRAIYTCNQLGIESSGYSATKYDYLGESYYKFREILALHKAVWDLYISPPEYIGGEKEDDFVD